MMSSFTRAMISSTTLSANREVAKMAAAITATRDKLFRILNLGLPTDYVFLACVEPILAHPQDGLQEPGRGGFTHKDARRGGPVSPSTLSLGGHPERALLTSRGICSCR